MADSPGMERLVSGEEPQAQEAYEFADTEQEDDRPPTPPISQTSSCISNACIPVRRQSDIIVPQRKLQAMVVAATPPGRLKTSKTVCLIQYSKIRDQDNKVRKM